MSADKPLSPPKEEILGRIHIPGITRVHEGMTYQSGEEDWLVIRVPKNDFGRKEYGYEVKVMRRNEIGQGWVAGEMTMETLGKLGKLFTSVALTFTLMPEE